MSNDPITVLIIAQDAVIGALMHAMVELSGHTPLSPRDDEHPLRAMDRLRPTVTLLDCEHDVACEEAAFERASLCGTRLILFSAMRSERELEDVARRRQLPSFVLPIRHREFVRRLDEVVSGRGPRGEEYRSAG